MAGAEDRATEAGKTHDPAGDDVVPAHVKGTAAARSVVVRWAVLLALAAVLLAAVMLFVDPIVGRWAIGICEQRWSLTIRESAIPLGGPVPPLGAMIALLVLARRWRWAQAYRAALLLPIVFVVSGLAGHAIKITVQRPRPFMRAKAWPQETRWQRMWDARFQSFPSGDVTVSGALAMVGFLLVGKRRVGYLLFAVPAYSATARMVGARHYPSDCLAGFMLGGLIAWLLWRYQERRWPLPRPPDEEPSSLT
jgi:membrane-associated phospholipid phosphatase